MFSTWYIHINPGRANLEGPIYHSCNFDNIAVSEHIGIKSECARLKFYFILRLASEVGDQRKRKRFSYFLIS